MANNLTTDEQQKGNLSFMNEVVDPSGQANGQGGTVVRRYDTTPTPPATAPTSAAAPAADPLTTYYNNLADPAVQDQSLRDSIQKNMNDALAAIDTKYVSIYSDKLGQTRAINARSGTQGSDFGNAATDATRTSVDTAKNAEKQVVQIDYSGQLNKLAADEISARKADALGKATQAQAIFDQNKKSAQDLIVSAAKSGQELTPDQKAVLMRNSGYDELTFDSIYNANKPQPQYSNFQQLKDGSLVAFDQNGNMKNYGKYDLPQDFQFVMGADGTPLVWDKSTGQVQIASGFKEGQFAKNTGNGPGNSKPTEQESAQKADSYFQQKAGADTFISPQDWQTGLDAWVSDGHTISSFLNRFKAYANPADLNDYWGLKAP